MDFIEELKSKVNKEIIDRNKIAMEKERERIRDIKPEDCLAINEEDILNYGFFHMTDKKNIESILENGCQPRIGKNSEGYESNKRAYFAIGALGTLGTINRGIYLKKQEILKNIAKEKYNIKESSFDENVNYRSIKDIFQKEDYEYASKSAFDYIEQVLENSEYLLFRINDGIEYDLAEIKNNPKVHTRNFHTKNNVGIPKEKIEKFEINGSSNAKDIFMYLSDKVNLDEVMTGTSLNEFFENEELYLHEFKKYIEKEKTMDEKECL